MTFIRSYVGGLFASGLIGSPAVASPGLPGQVIDITAGDFFFQAPATARPGLTTLRLRLLKGGHEVMLYRLDGSHSATDLVKSLATHAPTPWAKELGGPAFPAPGGTTNATYILEPGKYAIVCGIHAKDGQRHFQKGMFGEIAVAGRRVPGKLPSPDVVVTMVDHKYQFSAPVTAGRHVIRVMNAGTVYHELKILSILPGFTPKQSLDWTPGQPRMDEDFATVAMEPGVSLITTIDFRAGDYTIICVPQLKHGMKQTLHVAAATPGSKAGSLGGRVGGRRDTHFLASPH